MRRFIFLVLFSGLIFGVSISPLCSWPKVFNFSKNEKSVSLKDSLSSDTYRDLIVAEPDKFCKLYSAPKNQVLKVRAMILLLEFIPEPDNMHAVSLNETIVLFQNELKNDRWSNEEKIFLKMTLVKLYFLDHRYAEVLELSKEFSLEKIIPIDFKVTLGDAVLNLKLGSKNVYIAEKEIKVKELIGFVERLQKLSEEIDREDLPFIMKNMFQLKSNDSERKKHWSDPYDLMSGVYGGNLEIPYLLNQGCDEPPQGGFLYFDPLRSNLFKRISDLVRVERNESVMIDTFIKTAYHFNGYNFYPEIELTQSERDTYLNDLLKDETFIEKVRVHVSLELTMDEIRYEKSLEKAELMKRINNWKSYTGNQNWPIVYYLNSEFDLVHMYASAAGTVGFYLLVKKENLRKIPVLYFGSSTGGCMAG
jgi:hypothetical protein